MKSIDAKSVLLGILASTLLLTLTSGKMSDEDVRFEFLATQASVGIYNTSTRTIYIYPVTFGARGLQEAPANIYKVAEDG